MEQVIDAHDSPPPICPRNKKKKVDRTMVGADGELFMTFLDTT